MQSRNPQLQKQPSQMVNPNYYSPQMQHQGSMKNGVPVSGYQQQGSTNNIDNPDLNNSQYNQNFDSTKLEDQMSRPNDNISNSNLDSQFAMANSGGQYKKGYPPMTGRPYQNNQQPYGGMQDNNASDGDEGTFRDRSQAYQQPPQNAINNPSSDGLKKPSQDTTGGGAQVVKWTPNQQGLNQDEDLCLIKEVFAKSNSYDAEMQRQITSDVQKFKQNNQNLTIRAIKLQDEPSFKLEIKDKKRKDFKELVLMVCPRKDTPYEIVECKNQWSLNKQKIPKTNSLMDIIKFWWKFEFQTIEDEKKQTSNNNQANLHPNMNPQQMNQMPPQIPNNINPF